MAVSPMLQMPPNLWFPVAMPVTLTPSTAFVVGSKMRILSELFSSIKVKPAPCNAEAVKLASFNSEAVKPALFNAEAVKSASSAPSR